MLNFIDRGARRYLRPMGTLLLLFTAHTTLCSSDNGNHKPEQSKIVVQRLDRALEILEDHRKQQDKLGKQERIKAREYYDLATLAKGIAIRAPLLALWGTMLQSISKGTNGNPQPRFGHRCTYFGIGLCIGAAITYALCSYRAGSCELGELRHTLSERILAQTSTRLRQSRPPATEIDELMLLYRRSSPLHPQSNGNLIINTKELSKPLQTSLEQQWHTTLQEIRANVSGSAS